VWDVKVTAVEVSIVELKKIAILLTRQQVKAKKRKNQFNHFEIEEKLSQIEEKLY
jgi:hypothetical protein